MQALLAKGANPELPDLRGVTPLMAASASGGVSGVLEALFLALPDKAGLERVDRQGQNAAMHACAAGHVQTLDRLRALAPESNQFKAR